jgi:hypothetical protein
MPQDTDSDAQSTKYRWKNINKKRGKPQKDYAMLLTWRPYASVQLSGSLMFRTSGGGQRVQTISLVFPNVNLPASQY